ncbi:cell division protein FtsZ [Helicobacter marmotae]|uniref:Cell division protein FtsZ n=1 Tax=Helicobacter marmotae TaxID=152490 RepID=A0A3D8I787_9HELI|nr:cell division protein FtsZ [Helicobacter marmotae]RDU61008.1 cell division protein FtsZ [Helicobacter marmotae]
MENVIDIQEVQPSVRGVVITVIGVGGGGSHMISHLAGTTPHKSVRLVAANTDMQDLQAAKAETRMILGAKLTGGFGAGMRPEVGEEAALETYEEIKKALSGSNVVFVSAGLGGGTGTGAAPVVAKAAREIGALTIAVVTKPFKSEGKKRAKLAEDGLQKLKAESDCIVVIPNERLLSIIPPTKGHRESLEIVDEVLARAVNGMSNMILKHSRGMNVDLADVKTVMSYKGLALMGIGEETGEYAAVRAMQLAIESPLLDNISIQGAKGVIVYYEAHPNYPMPLLAEALKTIEELAEEGADIIQGIDENPELPQDYIRVTVIATGFEKELVAPQNEENKLTPATSQNEAMQNFNTQFRVVSSSFKEEHGLFDNELDVPAYLRAARD